MSKKKKTQMNDIGTINNDWKGREKKSLLKKPKLNLSSDTNSMVMVNTYYTGFDPQ
jgi:hypothetical protein